MYNSKLSVTATNRSEKPAKGQIICQRTDYLSFYRFTDLLNDRLKLSELNFIGKIVQMVISAFIICSAHFVTFFPYEQVMVFMNSVISLELSNNVCYVILH